VAHKTTNDEGLEPDLTQAQTENLGGDPGTERRRRRSRSRIDASINLDELRELIALIRENGLSEFELENQGFRVRLRREEVGRPDLTQGHTFLETPVAAERETRGAALPPQVPIPAHPGALAETAASEDQDLFIITSPIVGTFYRSPSPNAEAFVKIGSSVETETVVCIIEAMKLMNEIQAETSGEVAKIYVENGQPVEYGQPLFGIKG
jgi:acetyl-CoA carboxylase biotin carboxyl carrier protein